MMLIEHFDLEVFTPPCEPGAERYAAIARLTADISEVLPYLNATLRGAVYHQAANALTWKKGGHNIAFHAYEIGTSNAEDREAASQEVESLVKLVNRTWERRAEITPNYETHQRPTPMAVCKLLPQTNCRQCGEADLFHLCAQTGSFPKKVAAVRHCSSLYAGKTGCVTGHHYPKPRRLAEWKVKEQ